MHGCCLSWRSVGKGHACFAVVAVGERLQLRAAGSAVSPCGRAGEERAGQGSVGEFLSGSARVSLTTVSKHTRVPGDGSGGRKESFAPVLMCDLIRERYSDSLQTVRLCL